MEYLIDVRGLSKTFRSKLLQRPLPALGDVTLRVEPGEIYGFLGPNGAGKTTTIKILLGLIRPSGGDGTVLGRPFGRVGSRRELGYLPDAPNFYRSLDARELLRFSGRLHGLGGPDLERRIIEVLERVKLPPEAWGRRLRTYSRGMLQRVGIAAAILHRPRLVILDEPLNGLDPLGRHDFRELILSLKTEGTAVFLSSHVLADIESTADRVGILAQGRLIQSGTLSEILDVDGRGLEIGFRLENRQVVDEIAQRMESFRPAPSGWLGRVADAREGEHVVRRVLDAGGELLSYQPHRVSLEEFFLRQVVGVAHEAESIRKSASPSKAGPGSATRDARRAQEVRR